MSKKGYQKRLPTVLVPAPRPAPDLESQPPAPDQRPDPRPDSRPAPRPATAPAPAPAPDGSRTTGPGLLLPVGLVLVSLALVAGLVAGLAVVLPRLAEDDPPRSTPAADVAAPGVPSRATESYVEADVARNGTIAVRQWIRPDARVRRVSLALPDVPAGVALSATDVQVLVDGRPTSGPARIDGGRETYRFAPTTSIQLSYVLVGAVTISDSATGRALASATTLDVSYPHRSGSETRVVRAPRVLALACTPSADRAPEPCGTADGDDWRVELSGSMVGDRVVAQLDVG